jgi:hypothetical protein
LTRSVRCLLGRGTDFFNEYGCHHNNHSPDLDRLRDVWDQHGEQFLAEWIVEHPGYRPWAWWKLDAPEPRRRHIGGAIEACDEPGAPEHVRNNIHFGRCGAAGKAQCEDYPILESELDYLARHDLLEEGEAERHEALGIAADPHQRVLKIDNRDSSDRATPITWPIISHVSADGPEGD